MVLYQNNEEVRLTPRFLRSPVKCTHFNSVAGVFVVFFKLCMSPKSEAESKKCLHKDLVVVTNNIALYSCLMQCTDVQWDSIYFLDLKNLKYKSIQIYPCFNINFSVTYLLQSSRFSVL